MRWRTEAFSPGFRMQLLWQHRMKRGWWWPRRVGPTSSSRLGHRPLPPCHQGCTHHTCFHFHQGPSPPRQPTRLRERAGQLQAPRAANTTPTAAPGKPTAWVIINAASREPCWWTSHITPHVDSCCGLTGRTEVCCPSDPHASAVNASPSPPAAGQLWGLPCFAGLRSPSRGSQPV